MNKKVLFTIAPAALLMGVLVGCNNSSEFTVTFDTDGGTAIDAVKVKKGEKVARPATNPVKKDYAFKNWYTTKDGTDVFDFDTAINANTTIYAHYHQVSELKVKTTLTPATYEVGYEFDKDDLQVDAVFDDGSFRTLQPEEYTVSPELPYTFVSGDVATGKEFTIFYINKAEKVTVKVIEAKTEEEKFYEVYKKASDAFQNSTNVYDASDITYKYDGEAKTVSTVTYEKSETEKVRYAHIATSDDSQEIAGGDDFTYFDDDEKGIKAYISNLKTGGATFTFSSDASTGECGFSYYNSGKSAGESYKFNKNGYVTEIKIKSDHEDIITFAYNGEPHESDKEKFLEVYKAASDNFQESVKAKNMFDILDMALTVDGAATDLINFEIKELDVAEFIITDKNNNEYSIAGGNMTYLEDENDGIKKVLKDAEDSGATLTYTSDKETGECSFTATKGENSIYNKFNKYGYSYSQNSTGKEKIEVNYTGIPHSFHIKTAKYDETEAKYVGTIGDVEIRDLIFVSFTYDSKNNFNTITCPDYSLSSTDNNSDIRVCAVSSSEGEMTNWKISDNKIVFDDEISKTITVSLKVTKADGIKNLTINATKEDSWETLADLAAAKAFVTSTYASKTAATMQSIDVTYDGTNSTSSGATTVNNNMKKYFDSDYIDNSLYYTGNRTSSSVGTYFEERQSDYEPIVTTTFLDKLESEISFMGGELVYKKKGSEFYIKGTINVSGSGMTIKIETEYYYNSNGQCISYYNDYYYEETDSYICAYVEDCEFNY